MRSYEAYGLNKISPKVLIGIFVIVVLTPLISIALKVGGVIKNAEPIAMSAFGVMGVILLVLGIYMLKESFLIRQLFIVAEAEVVDNLMTIAGRAIKIKFSHNNKPLTATVLLTHGHKRKGSKVRVLFDPSHHSTVYLYGFKYYFVPAIPVIVGAVFAGLVTKYILG